MSPPEPSQSTHLHYLRHALSLARLSPPKPTNFRVGCVLVSFASSSTTPAIATDTDKQQDLFNGEILSTGYTLELPGNTHAEQNALAKLAARHDIALDGRGEEALNELLTPERNVHLYTSLEPCGLRLSGATPCVQRILATRQGNEKGGIRKVVFGAKEPGTFVKDSRSLGMLDEGGVEWEYVPGLAEEILKVAKEGHGERDGAQKEKEKEKDEHEVKGTDVEDISSEEGRRQEQQPRNPKKRMMEVDLSR